MTSPAAEEADGMTESGALLYEYRRYECVPGQIHSVLARFENFTFPLWKKHGVRCLGFWQAVVGESDHLHYILVWNGYQDRELRWTAFRTDPEWVAARTETERHGPLVAQIHNELWALAPFSPAPPGV
jgi:hypothetical protein